MLGLHKRLNAGDTMVEVMIAMAVLSTVLGSAYSIASKSLQLGRRAQERTEALKLVEGQIEQLKLMASNNKYEIFDTGNIKFCIKNATRYSIVGDINNYDDFPLECRPQDKLYNVSVEYDSATNDTFTVRARWQKLGAVGEDEVSVKYRLHK